jgi:anti-sigma factor RsiW
MNCWRTKQLLAAYLDGELSPSETTLVEEHVEGCPECAELRDRIASLPPLDLPRLDPEAEDRIWARMDAALEQAWERRDTERPPGLATTLRERMAGWFQMGKLSIPVPVAAAYLLLIAGLTGWNLVTYYKVQNLTVAMEEHPVSTPVATELAAPGAASESKLMRSSITSPLDFVADDDADGAPAHISVPVVDSATGEVLYYVEHKVDSGPPIGY